MEVWQIAAAAFVILGVGVYLILKRDTAHVDTSEESVEQELRRRGRGD